MYYFVRAMRNVKIELFDILFLFLFFLFPVILSNNLDITIFIRLLCICVGFTFIGKVLCDSTTIFQNCTSIARTAIAFFIGGLFCIPLLFIVANTAYQLPAIVILLIAFVLAVRGRVSYSFKIVKQDIILIVSCLCLLALLTLQTDATALFVKEQRIYQQTPTDPIFFTALVSTIRNGSIYNAIYEVGSPVNYHSFAFFLPALVANILDISSYQALWVLIMPFYKLLALLSCHELVFLFWARESTGYKNLKIFLSVAMPVFLAPLHPLYILKGDVLNFIHNGVGYIIYGNSSTSTFGLLLFLLNTFVFLKINWLEPNIKNRIFFACFAPLLAIGKLPIFFVFTIFIGTIVLYRSVFCKHPLKNYLLYIILYILITAFLYVLFFTHEPSGKTVFRFGYVLHYYAELFNRPLNSTGDYVIVFAITILLFTVWMGVRLIGVFYAWKSTLSKELVIGGIVGFIASLCVSLFVAQLFFDGEGNMVKDGSFDVLFLIRFSFFLLTIVATIGFSYLFRNNKNKFQKAIFASVLLWMTISLSTYIANAGVTIKNAKSFVKPVSWYEENYAVLKTGRLDDGLILINPWNTRGIALTSTDYGKFWTSFAVGDGLYNSTLKNAYRWTMYKQLLSSNDDKMLKQVIKEGVRYIIADSTNIEKFTDLSKRYPTLIKPVSDSKWVFQTF